MTALQTLYSRILTKYLWLCFIVLTWLILTDDERDAIREELSK